MAKTEVILTHNIVGLGGESDQVRVAAGYARNYLLPQGLAIPLTQGNKRQLEALRQRRAEREAHELNSMTELAKSISKLVCKLAVKTGDDGKMFGSVTNGTIADALKTQFEIALDKKKIHLEHPIRALGSYDVELRLHADIKTSVKVIVESLTPLEKPAEEPKAVGPISEKRGKRHDAKAESEAPPAKAEKGAPGKADKAPRAERPTKTPAKTEKKK